MWESPSFSAISDLSKLVFISLISHADDEGRGRAGASYIRSMTFPNDEDRRVADIKKTLIEIGSKMSVQFYAVDGNEYYVITNWLKWQKIDKPTKSKLPPPPLVGEGGTTLFSGVIDEYSESTRGRVDDDSPPNRIEGNRTERNNSHSAGAREKGSTDFEKRFSFFCKRWDIEADYCSPYMDDLDFDRLDKAFEQSPKYLQDKEAAPWAHTLSGIVTKYKSIIAGKYKDKTATPAQGNRGRRSVTQEWANTISRLNGVGLPIHGEDFDDEEE